MAELADDIRRALQPYRDVVRRYLAGQLRNEELEDAYNRPYLADATRWPEEVFTLLDGIFAEIEEFVPDRTLRQRLPDAVDEHQLRSYLQRALPELDALLA